MANGWGTVYKLNRDGSGGSVLYSFGGTTADGCSPQSALAQGSDLALYGTTFEGGEQQVGAVFIINKDGRRAVSGTGRYARLT